MGEWISGWMNEGVSQLLDKWVNELMEELMGE